MRMQCVKTGCCFAGILILVCTTILEAKDRPARGDRDSSQRDQRAASDQQVSPAAAPQPAQAPAAQPSASQRPAPESRRQSPAPRNEPRSDSTPPAARNTPEQRHPETPAQAVTPQPQAPAQPKASQRPSPAEQITTPQTPAVVPQTPRQDAAKPATPARDTVTVVSPRKPQPQAQPGKDARPSKDRPDRGTIAQTPRGQDKPATPKQTPAVTPEKPDTTAASKQKVVEPISGTSPSRGKDQPKSRQNDRPNGRIIPAELAAKDDILNDGRNKPDDQQVASRRATRIAVPDETRGRDDRTPDREGIARIGDKDSGPGFRRPETGRPSMDRPRDPDRSDRPRPSFEPRRLDDRAGRIIIHDDDRINFHGTVTFDRPRPWIPPHRFHDIHSIRSNPFWVGWYGNFVFRWSNFSCGLVAVVPCSDWYGTTYYYPAYHRKYVFVSVGGCWPTTRYIRYYWYGAHPYYWYGATVIPSTAYTGTTVYNTYNTYNTYTAPAGSIDYSTLSQQTIATANAVDAPQAETAADIYFEQGVQYFEAGNYTQAVLQFYSACCQAPDDVVLSFAYAQALFAAGDYPTAAAVIRNAMASIPADEPTIYYPRGLYPDETVLRAQVAALEQTAAVNPYLWDTQLLLGYQYVGLGDLAQAARPLSESTRNPANADAAAKLLDLAARLENAK